MPSYLIPVSLSIGGALVVCAIIFVVISYFLQRRHRRMYGRNIETGVRGQVNVRSVSTEDTITKFHKETKDMELAYSGADDKKNGPPQNLLGKMMELENP